jgi:hypothetical protein
MNRKDMVMYIIGCFLVIMGIFSPVLVYAGGASQSAASNRGRYLTGLGYIYQPEEIQIDSLLSKEDYNYPLPQNGALNITTDSDIRNNTGFIQIGLKGKKDSFQNMNPMNISFVIDISGSMADRDKLSWVKNSFYIFINNVRAEDIISVVIFEDKPEILIPPTQIKDDNDRNQFKRKVDTLKPRGGADILKGMTLGFSQVELNYQNNYTNRVLLLTDGMHNGSGTKDDIIDIVERYNSRNINISTIALGASADINLMVDMATQGGGSSRFISDYDEYEIYLTAGAISDFGNITNNRIKKGEGFVAYDKSLISISELANTIVGLQRQYQSTNDAQLRDQLVGSLNKGIGMIKFASIYLNEINNSLGGNEYHDELTTLGNYEKSFMESYENYIKEPGEILKQ